MKLSSTFKKLPLIALLSLGLACSPLVANADGGDRGRHGHSQQDRGKSHHKVDHRRDYREYADRRDHGYRHSYRKGYKHGYKDRRHHKKRHGHRGHRYDSHRYYGHDHHYDRYRDHVGLLLGLYSDNLAVIYRD